MDPFDAKTRDLEETLSEARRTQEELEECGEPEDRLEAAQAVEDAEYRLSCHLLKDHQEDLI